jgi:hypothetical protein
MDTLMALPMPIDLHPEDALPATLLCRPHKLLAEPGLYLLSILVLGWEQAII